MDRREGDVGAQPSDDFTRLLDGMSLVHDVALKPVLWSNIPSPHMDLGHMMRLCRDVDAALADPGMAGAVILHGTDLLVETAFVLDQLLVSTKPVVLTGAMRHLGEQGYDGVRNLQNSIQACLALPESCETVIQMADKLYTATDAVKADSLSVEPFIGQNLGSVGRFTNEGAKFVHTSRVHRPRLAANPAPPSLFVPLITCYPGMDGTLIRAAVENGAAGMVIEGFGAGNVTPELEKAISNALDNNVTVVLTTRCLKGGVWPCYGYPGGAASLMAKGVISARYLSGTKAQLLLALALESSIPPDAVAELYKEL